jgi:hypothetical protein
MLHYIVAHYIIVRLEGGQMNTYLDTKIFPSEILSSYGSKYEDGCLSSGLLRRVVW